MRWIFGLAFVLLCVGIFSVPDLASAQGLVPASCRGDNVPVTCGTCEFVQLVNNVIQFVIVIMSSVAVLVFMFAGFKLLTSGGNATARQSAVSLFSNVAIGYVLILGSFLIVDLIFRSVLDTNNSALLNWRTVQCVYPKAPTEGTVPGTLSPGSSVTAGTGRATGGGSCSVPAGAGGACSVDRLRAAGFGDAAAQANTICSVESGFNPTIRSSLDLTENPEVNGGYSIGLFQINLAAHTLTCGGKTLDCKSAFEDTGRRQGGVRIQRVTNQALFNECAVAAATPECNIAKAVELYKASGDFGDWACSTKKCGIATSRNHLCPL